jgi:Kdo2-lipid IVA lauroyltransferase/acyltransferase
MPDATPHPAGHKPKAKRKKPRTAGRVLLSWGPSRGAVELSLRAVMFCVTAFGHRWAYFWARVLATAGWVCMRRLRQTALRNVDLCFPDKPLAERTRIARASLRHFCYTFVDYRLVPRYFGPGKDTGAYFKGSGEADPYPAWISEDKAAFTLSAHFGNWEIGSWDVGSRGGQPLLVLAKPLRPPLINHWIVNARRVLGNEVVEHKGGARAYARALRERRQVAILVDQNAGSRGPWETFFGVPCTWQAEFTRLALRGGGRVAFQACRRVGERFCFEIVGAEIHEYPPDTEPMRIVRDYRDYLERVVGQWPEQYFWLHRRFKGRPKGTPDRYANPKQRLSNEEVEALIRATTPEEMRA